jgi:hypothetical protein
MPDWVWQGTFTSVVAALLFLGGATVLTWIRKRWPTYGNLALFWVASAACLGVLWFAVTGYAPFSSRPLRITTDNVEANMKLWCENLGLAFRQTNLPDTYFGYMITTRTGTQMSVSRRTKERPAYLQFETDILFAPEHQAVLSTLNKDQIETVMEEIGLELNKTRVGFTVGSLAMPQTTNNQIGQAFIALQKAAPIADLNENGFASYIDDMEFSAGLARNATQLALRRETKQRFPARP